MSIPKKKILALSDFYLPGFKSGGGMWTVVNLVERFADRYDFFIVTRNHDGKGDLAPYTDVETGRWNNVGPARVLYLPTEEITRRRIAAVIKEIGPDALLLNSTFSKSAIAALGARRFGRVGRIPMILLATGEMSKSALALKPLKKWAFLRYAKIARLHRDVIWKASFEAERDEIREAIAPDAEIWVAPDLPPKYVLHDFDPALKPKKRPGEVRFTFVSRIVRKKNLHFFLDLLKDFEGDVVFEIIGPPEDGPYWDECKRSIASLPPNITVDITGALPNDEILKRLCDSHFFVLPTLNENFGYVFVEAMAAGCPMLISDRTIWADVEARGVGWTVPLENEEKWRSAIEECIRMAQDEYARMSSEARKYAMDWLADPVHEQATERVIERALNGVSARDDQ